MGKTLIQWTQESWNPIVGCSIVSPGCTNCYAMKFAGARLDGNPNVPHYAGTTQKSKAGYVWTGKLAMAPKQKLTEPLRRKKPTTYFVNSMGDLFHEDCPDEWIDQVFAVMALAPQHTFQCLTKRPARMREYVNDPRRRDLIARAIWRIGNRSGGSDLASGQAGRKSESQFCRSPLPASQGGIQSAGRLPASDDYDCRQENDSVRPQGGLDPLQGGDTARHNDQPQGREQGEQQTQESGARDVLGTAASRHSCLGGEKASAQGEQQSKNLPSGNRRLNDEVTAQVWRASEGNRGAVRHGPESGVCDHHREDLEARVTWPLHNVWLGVSCEDQKRADERLPHLVSTPAAVRFVSAEPLLSAVSLGPWLAVEQVKLSTGLHWTERNYEVQKIDWVIAGGESGPGARPMHPDWARSLRDQCAAARTAFHFKQWGEFACPDAAACGMTDDPVWRRFPIVAAKDPSKLHIFEDGTQVARIGKKAAGRLLDGVEHNGMPESRS
jgi:protein gp37